MSSTKKEYKDLLTILNQPGLLDNVSDDLVSLNEYDQFSLELSCRINQLTEMFDVSTFVTYLGTEGRKSFFKIGLSRLTDHEDLGSLVLSSRNPRSSYNKFSKLISSLQVENTYSHLDSRGSDDDQ